MADRLGIVIPTWKEPECIGPLLQALAESAPDATKLVVDDSPDDATVQAAQATGVPGLEVWHRQGKGRGSAVLDGMRRLVEAGHDWVIEMDADLSHPPAQVPDLLAAARERGLDVVIASRYVPGGGSVNWPLRRRVLSKGANLLAKAVLRVPVSDYTTGYRIYSRRACDEILARCGGRGKGFIVQSESLVTAHETGMKIGEIPSIFTDRVLGTSTMGAHEMLGGLSALAKIWQLQREIRRERAG